MNINCNGFDKAFAHTSVLVDKLADFPAALQARLANILYGISRIALEANGAEITGEFVGVQANS